MEVVDVSLSKVLHSRSTYLLLCVWPVLVTCGYFSPLCLPSQMGQIKFYFIFFMFMPSISGYRFHSPLCLFPPHLELVYGDGNADSQRRPLSLSHTRDLMAFEEYPKKLKLIHMLLYIS